MYRCIFRILFVCLIVLAIIFSIIHIVTLNITQNEKYLDGNRKEFVSPTKFLNTKWTSEDGNMWFIIEDGHNESEDTNIEPYYCGYVRSDGEWIRMRVWIGNIMNAIYFAPYSDSYEEALYTRGEYECTEDKIVVTVDKERDDFKAICGEYDTIVFHSEPLKDEDGYVYSKSEGNARLVSVTNRNSKEIVVPEKLGGSPVTVLGQYSLYKCEDVVSVTIPETLAEIERGAFCRCSSLKTVYSPAGVKEIHSGAFFTCLSLQEIVVDDASEYYITEEGVLFNKHKTVLLSYPGGKEGETYTVPESVTEIRDWAFAQNEYLKEIVIGNNVVKMPSVLSDNSEHITLVVEAGSAAYEYAKANHIDYRVFEGK